METFIPELKGNGYGTMLVKVSECPLCGKKMVVPPADQYFERRTFPVFVDIDFERQLELAGWGEVSHTKVDDKYICESCEKEGKATFRCALCNEGYPTSDIQETFGDPPEFLCVTCYEKTSAKEWDKKVEQLKARHRWDFE